MGAETMERPATVTSKGQVTIPAEIRRQLGIANGGPVVFRSDGRTVTVESGRKPTLSELLAGFDPAKHRHGREERSWDDEPRGAETL